MTFLHCKNNTRHSNGDLPTSFLHKSYFSLFQIKRKHPMKIHIQTNDFLSLDCIFNLTSSISKVSEPWRNLFDKSLDGQLLFVLTSMERSWSNTLLNYGTHPYGYLCCRQTGWGFTCQVQVSNWLSHIRYLLCHVCPSPLCYSALHRVFWLPLALSTIGHYDTCIAKRRNGIM